ncbi:hypothetical protein CKO25_17155 [Thiocapsa imhoffii]|uniref:Uncharacterized protein n=1 Tax=Thiocapsa imhoffii TaxID=382777 RepID=A0A9X0WL20_9GAMM|nr:hypothetical protein [Thiocapsa imhoffii]
MAIEYEFRLVFGVRSGWPLKSILEAELTLRGAGSAASIVRDRSIARMKSAVHAIAGLFINGSAHV